MTDPDIRVEEATAVSSELLSTLRELVSQLSSASAPSERELEAIVSSPATRLLVARDSGGAVIGTLTLVLLRIPTGMRAWIEDVVVDEAARGRGTGERLIRAALALAEANGARTVDLTSRPSREAANRLYGRLGFERRDTNVYRFSSLEPPS
jgi:ribosomal protein S18 acetylase RimI-like enzyme